MAASPLANEMGNVLRNLARNLFGGIKSAAFLRVRPDTFRVSWAQLVALVILTLAPPLVADFWRLDQQEALPPPACPRAVSASAYLSRSVAARLFGKASAAGPAARHRIRQLGA
jgi:hypothetical protein